LNEKAKKLIDKIKFEDKDINNLFQETISER